VDDMTEYHEATPIPGPEAFEEHGRDAELSQAAIVLTAGAAVRGEMYRVGDPSEVGLPQEMRAIEREDRVPLDEAVAPLPIDAATHLDHPEVRLPPSASAQLCRQLVDQPDAVTAAALVEANLHSDSQLVRTAAAVAALDTTGPRDDVVPHLVEGAVARDQLTQEIGRIGLARVAPQHDVLRRLVGRPAPIEGTDRESHTAVLTHGTFAARTRWWRPGGNFYVYLDGLQPPLHMHDPSFGWSGQYSDGARQLAAQQMVAWMAAQGLQQPDLFAHSHGGTVGNLATTRGQTFTRLVLLSWPVHAEWFPDFTKVQAIIDIRVRFDLVIAADRGGQTFVPPPAFQNKVTSHINGWFEHSDTHDPAYWDKYGLPAVL
jgi:hypothetical protein